MQRWIPPLPEGWTARWDPAQQRFFFINHQTKTTQWDDPRFAVAAPPPQPQVNPYAAASSLSPSRGQARASSRSPSPAQAYQMQDMSSSGRSHQGHTSTRQGHHATSRQHQQESSMSEEVDQSLVDKLHRDFPNTTKALIADILVGCYNNEREAREQLDDLGFSIKSDERNPSTGASTATSSRNKPQQQAAAPKELSTLDKNRIHQQMSTAYPKASMDVIEMTMKVVKYDVNKGKLLLERYLENQKSSSSQATTSTSTTASTRGGSATGTATASTARAVSPAVMEPASLSASTNNQPQGLSAGSGQIPTNSVSRILIGSGGSSALSSSTSSGTGRQQPTQFSSAKQVTKLSEHLLNTTSDLLSHLTSSGAGGQCCPLGSKQAEDEDDGGDDEFKRRMNVPPKPKKAVVSQPQPRPAPTSLAGSTGGVRSPHRSSALGPDPSLRKGPDVSLLSNDLSQATGPDLSLRSGPDLSLRTGPDRSHVFGPMGASGPDMSLRCGPQASLLGLHSDQSGILVTEI